MSNDGYMAIRVCESVSSRPRRHGCFGEGEKRRRRSGMRSGLEFRCDCGAAMMIPYEQLTGVEHLARFLEEQAAAKRSFHLTLTRRIVAAHGSVGRRCALDFRIARVAHDSATRVALFRAGYCDTACAPSARQPRRRPRRVPARAAPRGPGGVGFVYGIAPGTVEPADPCRSAREKRLEHQRHPDHALDADWIGGLIAAVRPG